MQKRKELFVACSTVNKLNLTDKIEFHGKVPEDVICDFIEAIEDIDDQDKLDFVPEKVLDLYERLVDYDGDNDNEIKELVQSQKPLYEKKQSQRKRKYQYLIDRNDPDVGPSEEERRQILPRPLGRKLDV